MTNLRIKRQNAKITKQIAADVAANPLREARIRIYLDPCASALEGMASLLALSPVEGSTEAIVLLQVFAAAERLAIAQKNEAQEGSIGSLVDLMIAQQEYQILKDCILALMAIAAAPAPLAAAPVAYATLPQILRSKAAAAPEASPEALRAAEAMAISDPAWQYVRKTAPDLCALGYAAGTVHLSLKEAMAIAMNWHGGQNTALYSFGSTGKIAFPFYVYLNEIASNIPHETPENISRKGTLEALCAFLAEVCV